MYWYLEMVALATMVADVLAIVHHEGVVMVTLWLGVLSDLH